MITTSTQLKALVRNQSGGDSTKAQLIIRNYIMGRFLFRVSKSRYQNKIILKGGVLIASMVGSGRRSTMDIDTTIQNIDLDEGKILKMLEEIIRIDSDDNVIFEISKISTIMEELEYPGIRVSLNAMIDSMRTPLILDFSTGDIITPRAIEYNYKLMFDQGYITILAYNKETILAEKLETIISRGIANSRMRDFYDVHTILYLETQINYNDFNSALENTSKKRGSYNVIKEWTRILSEIEKNSNMKKLWSSYQKKFDYAKTLSWSEVVQAIRELGSHVVY